ncbi:hypothetical protein [Sphingobacterium sp.]|uniref:hypothetical protein n=1 Tax=Sphingobacterium sp. TaxID=341027 RepID=UPI00289A5431|nr:hypothetical protein [Sphingobacterium sp.]
MKNTEKKLKAKHFRYLCKDIVKNPMIYIRDFYRYETDIICWMNNIQLFVNAATVPEMGNRNFAENGYHCKEMIKQIEVAYVIFHQCQLPIQKKPLNFFSTKEDYHNYVFKLEYTTHGHIDPSDTISKFFSYQSLQKWYDTMDDIMHYLTVSDSRNYEYFGDQIMAIRELLMRLAFGLYYIYKDEGISLNVPCYVKAINDEPHQSTKEKTILRQMMEKSIDKKYAKKEAQKSSNDIEDSQGLGTSEIPVSENSNLETIN